MDKPHPLLEQLLPLMGEPDFEEIFARLTYGEPANVRFLLKMELNRRTAPCIRSIDLRARRNAVPYAYKGIQHFMTPEDIQVFEHAVQQHRGQYTLGVYETVLAQQKQRLEQEARRQADPGHDRSRFEVDAIPFAGYHQRREERLQFSSPAILRRPGQPPLPVRTSDLSCGGVRLALPHAVTIQEGESCEVLFTGMASEQPAEIINQPVSYQILGMEQRDDHVWLKLLRDSQDMVLDQYFNQFIRDNRSRYRVGVEHLLSAIEAKGYEQYYLPRMTGLPLFFSQDTTPHLLYALKTENNQSIIEFWRDERNHDTLTGLFTPLRMEQLLAQPSERKCCWLYVFTHTVRSHIYFFSATQEELDNNGLRALYFAIGARRPSWRVYKFELEPVRVDTQTLMGLLPDEDRTPSELEKLREQLTRIGWVGQLMAVDDDSQRREYLVQGVEPSQPNLLQPFAHPVDVPGYSLELLHYVQLRKERRFIHKTAVAVRTASETLIGWTRDISTQGLQVELERPLACAKGDVLLLNLPKMQELTRDMRLKDLAYKVVNLNQTHTILHLCIDGNPAHHTGSKFFKLLIDSNPDKLRSAPELRRTGGLARTLRHLFSYHLYTHPLYLSKSRPNRLGAIGFIDRPRGLDKLLRESGLKKPFNLMPLLQGDLLKQLLLVPLRDMRREDAPQQTELFIARLHDRLGNLVYDSRLERSFYNQDDKQRFVQQAVSKGRFYSVRLFLSRTGRPDIDYIARELDYVAKYAIHKAHQLEATLWSVIGICDLVDTTDATLYRLGVTQKKEGAAIATPVEALTEPGQSGSRMEQA